MKVEHAIEVAKARGFKLVWDDTFKVYTLTGTNLPATGIRAMWLSIIDEAEFIRDYLTGT